MIVHQIGDFDQTEANGKQFSDQKSLVTDHFVQHRGYVAFAAGCRQAKSKRDHVLKKRYL